METLHFARVTPCRTTLARSARAGTGVSGATGQARFFSCWRKSAGAGCVVLRRSASGERDGGFGGSPSKDDFAVEDEEQKSKGGGGGGGGGLVLGAERDASGSVVGFDLIPQTRPDFLEVTAAEGDKSIGEITETGETEGKEEAQTKVSYKIVFVTAEAAPYSKTGGLGDVCGSLPIALAARGHRVMVVSPMYLNGTVADERYAGALDLDHCIKIYCFDGVHEVSFFHEYRKGVDWVFVDHPAYHRPGNPYGDSYGAFGDNQFRFTLLCHAACEAPLVLPLGGFTYGENCLFLVNDWHASLVPVLLAAKYRPFGVYKDARCVLIIHNLAHQFYRGEIDQS